MATPGRGAPGPGVRPGRGVGAPRSASGRAPDREGRPRSLTAAHDVRPQRADEDIAGVRVVDTLTPAFAAGPRIDCGHADEARLRFRAKGATTWPTWTQSASPGSSNRSREPGSKVKLAKDFDPAFKAGVEEKKHGEELLQQGVELLARVPGASGRAGHLRRPRGAAGARRRRQGRHHPPRDERRQPAGRLRAQLQGAVGRRARPRLPVALRQRLPARGDIGIFNRSHYEEVLVVRVHPEILERQQLPMAWAQGTSGSGAIARSTTGSATSPTRAQRIVKIFLNLSKEEQRRRFLRRIDLPDKNWKFSAADVRERSFWDDYQEAFSRCCRTRHRVGALVRDPRRPQVVHALRGRAVIVRR